MKIKKCPDDSTYTLRDSCPDCGSPTIDPSPPKFSYPDRYGEYRRRAKRSAGEHDGE